ncbi:CAP domain-containing protein [Novosphingobium sp. ZN18A2]|uniref:CAP domain-containing protein n=1 Tax=Novosphingobium sp. ZN18A2 TaxID=3079861 RepID=UPI0030CC7563
MKTGRVLAVLGAAVALALTGQSATAQQAAGPNRFARELLAQHNLERDRLGIARLSWSHKLAQQAEGWAQVLARQGRMVHASWSERHGAGENLWMGAAGRYDADFMVGAFVNERQHFVRGTFPGVSDTGRWEDVGHYTQLIWPGTKEVGCAVAHNARDDFLVCRYWPAGNTVGVAVP